MASRAACCPYSPRCREQVPSRNLIGYEGKRKGRDNPRPSLASGFIWSPAAATMVRLVASGSGLVDLLVASGL